MIRTSLIAFVLIAFAGSLAAAPMLTISPVSQPVFEGHTVDVSVGISGLNAGGPPGVGSFDLTVLYDPSLLSSPTVTFSTFLGDPVTEAITGTTAGTGSIEAAEVSLLTSAQLFARQPGSFSLFDLSFIAAASGTATFSFQRGGVVDDVNGLKLVVTNPEPNTFVLAASALLFLLFGWTRVRRAARVLPALGLLAFGTTAVSRSAFAKDVSPKKQNVCIAVYRYGGAASGWTNGNPAGLFPSGTIAAIWAHISRANVVFAAENTVMPKDIVPAGVKAGDTYKTNVEWVWTTFPGDPAGVVQDLPDPFGNHNGDIDYNAPIANDELELSPGGGTGSEDLDFILKATADGECYPVVFVNSPNSGFYGLTIGQVVAGNVFLGVVTLVNSTAYPKPDNPTTVQREDLVSTLAHELSHAVCLDPKIAGWGDATGHPPFPQGTSGNPANPPDTPEGRGFTVTDVTKADVGKQLRDVVTWYTSAERDGLRKNGSPGENFTYRQAALANSCATALRTNNAPSITVKTPNFFGLPSNKILWGPAAPSGLVPPAVGLGLDGEALDAFSYDWNSFPPGRFAFRFSVDNKSQGFPGSAVQIRSAMVAPGADEYGAPVNLKGNNNVLLLGLLQFGLVPGDDISGLGQISPGFPIPPLNPNPIFKINGNRPLDGNQDGIMDGTSRVYFSVAPGGKGGLDPGTVYVAIGNGTANPTVVPYATSAELGLLPGDDIDALCVQDNGNGIYDNYPTDTILFSLTRKSPSVLAGANAVSSSDVLLGRGNGVKPAVYAPAATLGLRPGAADDLDGLKCYKQTICDINMDGKVDRQDIQLIFDARNLPASVGDPRDVDGDGTITTNDARICAQRCTNPLCQ